VRVTCPFDSLTFNSLNNQESNVDDAGEYVPRPIDTSSITLSRDIASLVELLSKNTHDVGHISFSIYQFVPGATLF
jgi:hypothetical protein